MTGEIVARWIEMPECLVHDRRQPCGGARVAGGEQRHIVTAAHQLLRQGRDDAFGATIARRWNRLERRSELCDAQVHEVPKDLPSQLGVAPDAAGARVVPLPAQLTLGDPAP